MKKWQKNSNGQCCFDAIIKFLVSVEQALGSVYNPKDDQGNGTTALLTVQKSPLHPSHH